MLDGTRRGTKEGLEALKPKQRGGSMASVLVVSALSPMPGENRQPAGGGSQQKHRWQTGRSTAAGPRRNPRTGASPFAALRCALAFASAPVCAPTRAALLRPARQRVQRASGHAAKYAGQRYVCVVPPSLAGTAAAGVRAEICASCGQVPEDPGLVPGAAQAKSLELLSGPDMFSGDCLPACTACFCASACCLRHAASCWQPCAKAVPPLAALRCRRPWAGAAPRPAQGPQPAASWSLDR